MAMTSDSLATIQRYYKTHTHKQIAEMVGVSHHAVRNACSENGWIKRDDQWSDADIAKLIAWYVRPGCQARDTLKLDALAKELGRQKSNVCRKAKTLGLTDLARPIALEETRRQRSRLAKQAIARNGHPRGALGMKHSAETLKVISEKSKQAWADQKKRPILGVLKRVKTVRTNLARYGVASPVQGINNGRNVYSRCRRGVREDLGFFVRSRWEANYARYLKWLQSQGAISAWEYEPITFRFDGVGRGPYTYKPDFKVVGNDGSVWFHEVKGWMDSASKGKIKRFAKFYPQHELVIVDAKQYRAIASKLSGVIPNWESE